MANDTAVTVIDQSPGAVVEYTLEDYPESRYNRLIPSDVIGMPTDLIRPIVRTVQLDIERDTYESRDLPTGHRAPNARGMALLADAAGVDFPNEERVDDGSNPSRASVKVWATFVDGTGRPRTATGVRDYDLTAQTMTDAQRNRAKGHIYEHASTRARHRALRLLIGLPQSYPVAELQKPFAVVSFVPNLQHPELREAYKQALLPALTSAFGPGAAKQLAAGDDVVDLDRAASEPRNITPAPAVPPTLPGEHLAAAAGPIDEPDWLKPSTTTPAAAPATTKRRGAKSLVERLAESYDASELQGDATESQQLVLRDLVKDLPWATELYPVLRAAFGADWDGKLDAPHAQAVLNTAEAYAAAEPPIDFAEAWKTAAADARKAAAA